MRFVADLLGDGDDSRLAVIDLARILMIPPLGVARVVDSLVEASLTFPAALSGFLLEEHVATLLTGAPDVLRAFHEPVLQEDRDYLFREQGAKKRISGSRGTRA